MSARKVPAAQPGVGDANQDPIAVHLLDHAADLAVVEPDRLSGADVVEHLGNRAADAGGCEDAPGAIEGGGTARREVPGHDEQVPRIQGDRVRARRQVAESGPALGLLGTSPPVTQARARHEVDRLIGRGPAPLAGHVDDAELSSGLAGIAETHCLADAKPRQPGCRHVQARIGRRGRRARGALRRQPDPGGSGDASVDVALRADAEHAPGLARADPCAASARLGP